MTENAQAKGRRYASEGRLVVELVNGDEIRALCRGAGAVYDCGHDGKKWFCTCPAFGRCAHLNALMLVTRRPA